MLSSAWPRRAAILAACLGATAVTGVASASAAGNGETIYGTGSSLQGVAETNQGANGVLSSGGAPGCVGTDTGAQWWGLVGAWYCKSATTQTTLLNAPVFAKYTVESSGIGLAEFGNAASSSGTCGAAAAGQLNPQCDPNAGTFTPSELDAFIGTDDPPNAGDLTNASAAAGAGVQEVTLPVTQAPVALILSLPAGLTLNTTGNVKLSSQEVADIYDASVPAQAGCPATTNTWCDLLVESGLTRITTGNPTKTQFKDTTADTDTITLQARSSGSGTTFSLRGYLYELDKYGLSGLYPYTLVTDGPADWPVATSQAGNTSGSQLVANTTANPGSLGYANLADAANASPAYKKTPVTTGGHQIIYALVQDNFESPQTNTAFYASPSNSAGTVNLYTGAAINTAATSCAENAAFRKVGCWQVPTTATGAWSSSNEATPGTIPSDADVGDHGTTAAGVTSKAYPIVAVTYDVFWTDYDNAASNLDTGNGGGSYYADATCPGGDNCNTDAGNAAASFAKYLTGTGQSNLSAAKVYYGALPAAVKSKAATFAKSVTP
jgi:hypothetical protein